MKALSNADIVCQMDETKWCEVFRPHLGRRDNKFVFFERF